MVAVTYECSTIACGGKHDSSYKIILKMLWNILKVVQFVAAANNCIHVNNSEI